MNNGLKQLEFHRDAKIAENRDDDENLLEFRRLFRDKFSKFVKEHSQSETEDFAEKSLKEVWTLVNELESKKLESGRFELEKVLNLEATDCHDDEKLSLKGLASSQSADTNEKTKPDNTKEELNFIPIHAPRFESSFKSSNITEVIFRQEYLGIPVYDSLSVVQVDLGKKEIISIHSSLIKEIKDNNKEVSPVATLKKEEVKDLIQEKTGVKFDSHVDFDAKLFYYFDSNDEKWRLVYITDIKRTNSSDVGKNDVELDYMNMVDYIIDAHSGEIVGEKPCVRSLMALD
jgi:hypothetical protein